MPPAWAGELIARIAVPRLPGSKALNQVEQIIAERLAAMGYAVARQPFAASARRLTAVAVGGAALGWSTLGIAPLLMLPFPAWPAVLVGAAALGLAGLLVWGVAAGRLAVGGPEVAVANLVATRGAVTLWLVAHADSKAQRFSLAGRVLAVAAAGIGTLGLAALLAGRLAGPVPWWAALPVAAVALLGGAALSLGAPQDRSPGAVDNASGVVAALVAAEQLRDRADVGVLITSAEEFGMLGAEAWVRGGGSGGTFINFDGVDSRGAYRLQLHPTRRSARAVALRGALQVALAATGHRVVTARLPMGTFVDGAVLARADMPGVTLSRGDWVTLGVVHTPRDEAARLDPAAAVVAGEAAAAATRRLLG